MTTTPDRTGRRAAIAMLIAATVAAFGCGDSRLLTGAYRSSATAPVVIEGVEGTGNGVYMQLVLGEYGQDVVGIIRFYEDPDFIQPIQGVCRCRFLTQGRFEGGVLVFGFPNPSPCVKDATELISARLTESGNGDTLEGPVGRDLAKAQSARFERVTDGGDLGTNDKVCDEIGSEVPVDSGPGDDGPDVGEGAE